MTHVDIVKGKCVDGSSKNPCMYNDDISICTNCRIYTGNIKLPVKFRSKVESKQKSKSKSKERQRHGKK